MILTFSELQQAASGLTDADVLLQILERPAFWALNLFSLVLSLVLLVGRRFVRVAPKYQHLLSSVMLVFTTVGATLALPVSQAWVAVHGELAQKSAQFLGWQRTEAASFSRFEVLLLKRDLAHDAQVGTKVLAGILQQGGTQAEAEPGVMFALATLHRSGGKVED